jgi:L-arabinose isomerase
MILAQKWRLISFMTRSIHLTLMNDMTALTPLRIGLFGVGLETYWPQFEGLKDRLLGYQSRVRERLAMTAEVMDAGLVDNPSQAATAASIFNQAEVDLIFLYISTYALSSTVLPVVQRSRVPVVVLNLQPVAQLDYEAFNRLADRGAMTSAWLEHCQSCAIPEIAGVFHRADIPFHVVTGFLDDQHAWKEIDEWIEAARVAANLRQNRVGMLGHYYSGMLDVYSDLTQHSAVFKNHFELLEIDELLALRSMVSPSEIQAKFHEFHSIFDVSAKCEPAELERAAQTACALDSLVAKHRLGSLAYYYEGEEGSPHRDLATSVIAGTTLLTGRNIPVAGECEIKNVQAMKILDLFAVGGSFSEFYLTDFKEDVIFLGHDGPAHFAIAQGRVGLVPLSLYHGKPGKGLSIQMTVAHGPVTLVSIVQHRNGKLSLLVAEGESLPGPVLQIGNTNSRYRFPIGVKEFMNRWSSAGPAHHCAIGVGHVATKLEKLAQLLGIAINQIC